MSNYVTRKTNVHCKNTGQKGANHFTKKQTKKKRFFEVVCKHAGLQL